MKKFLPVVDEKFGKLFIYNNINSAVILLPLLYLFTDEWIELEVNREMFQTNVFWTFTLATSIIGYLLSCTPDFQMEQISPMSHNVAKTSRISVQTAISYVMAKSNASGQTITGNIVIIATLFIYTQLKRI